MVGKAPIADSDAGPRAEAGRCGYVTRCGRASCFESGRTLDPSRSDNRVSARMRVALGRLAGGGSSETLVARMALGMDAAGACLLGRIGRREGRETGSHAQHEGGEEADMRAHGRPKRGQSECIVQSCGKQVSDAMNSFDPTPVETTLSLTSRINGISDVRVTTSSTAHRSNNPKTCG